MENNNKSKCTHYNDIAGHYSKNIFYDPESVIVKNQSDSVSKILWPDGGEHTKTVVDCGAGTCVFASILAQRWPQCKFMCVEPSAEMVAEGKKRCAHLPNVQVFEGTIEDFIETLTITPMTSFLCKEMMHHIPALQRQRIFTLMAGAYKVLIINRPHKCAYPFFPAALEAWESGADDLSIYRQEMEQSRNFADVHAEEINIADISMSRSEWSNLVRTRFWSNLSHFTDKEMDDGIAWIESSCASTVSFTEKQVFILGGPATAHSLTTR